MSRYLEMLKSGKRPDGDAAKPAKMQSVNLAGFAGSTSGHFSKNREAANDPSPVRDDSIEAPQSADGGMYLPWGPYLDQESVNRMRADLVAMIEELADTEQWPGGVRDDVLTRAIRGPLADLMPNLAHFNERLTAARAEAEARKIADARAYRVTDDVLRRRGYRV